MSKNLLLIGRDSSAAVEGSQLFERLKVYDQYHEFTLIIINKGGYKKVTIGRSDVILAGGTTLPTAFFRGIYYVFCTLRQKSFQLISSQDVLYAGVVGYFFSKLHSLPLFVQVHGDHLDNQRWFESDVGYFNRLMNGVGKFILKRADYVRVVSERLRQQLIKTYALKPNRVISIPIGTNLDLFTHRESVARTKAMLFAQRLLPEKCPMLFAQVATTILKTHADATVMIAGDGFLRPDVEAYFAEAGVLGRVTFYGAVNQLTLAELYQTAYCYVHTADWEGWGMPMIEAIASGCPVVTTDTGCAGEAIRHEETGLVTAINDEADLVTQINRLYTDTALWQRLSNHGRVESMKWSFTSLARKNMEWYEQNT